MKKIIIPFLSIFIVLQRSYSQMDTLNFKSERISKTSSIIIDKDVELVFPLFGAFEERKWADGWNPHAIYPSEEVIAEGTTFKTPGHSRSETELLWIVSKYHQQDHQIQYLVLSANRYWTITIDCRSLGKNKTEATIGYSFTGLNDEGNRKNEHSLQSIYEHDLRDWSEAINSYFSKHPELN
jgi:hypothetical protein